MQKACLDITAALLLRAYIFPVASTTIARRHGNRICGIRLIDRHTTMDSYSSSPLLCLVMIIAISIKMERKRSATTSLGGQRVRGIRKSISSILLKIALEIIKDGFKESFKSFFHNFFPVRLTGYVIPISPAGDLCDRTIWKPLCSIITMINPLQQAKSEI